jgi:hypothetical protein
MFDGVNGTNILCRVLHDVIVDLKPISSIHLSPHPGIRDNGDSVLTRSKIVPLGSNGIFHAHLITYPLCTLLKLTSCEC